MCYIIWCIPNSLEHSMILQVSISVASPGHSSLASPMSAAKARKWETGSVVHLLSLLLLPSPQLGLQGDQKPHGDHSPNLPLAPAAQTQIIPLR